MTSREGMRNLEDAAIWVAMIGPVSALYSALPFASPSLLRFLGGFNSEFWFVFLSVLGAVAVSVLSCVGSLAIIVELRRRGAKLARAAWVTTGFAATTILINVAAVCIGLIYG